MNGLLALFNFVSDMKIISNRDQKKVLSFVLETMFLSILYVATLYLRQLGLFNKWFVLDENEIVNNFVADFSIVVMGTVGLVLAFMVYSLLLISFKIMAKEPDKLFPVFKIVFTSLIYPWEFVSINFMLLVPSVLFPQEVIPQKALIAVFIVGGSYLGNRILGSFQEFIKSTSKDVIWPWNLAIGSSLFRVFGYFLVVFPILFLILVVSNYFPL